MVYLVIGTVNNQHTVHSVFYAGTDLREASNVAHEHKIPNIDIWQDGKYIGHVYLCLPS